MSHSVFRCHSELSPLQATREDDLPSFQSDQSIDSEDLAGPQPFLVSASLWKNVTSLVPVDHRLGPDALLDRFILHHLRLDGARALRFLIRHPDRAFSAQAVWQALSGFHPDSLSETADASSQPQSSLLESSISITDEQCLRQINQELDRLQRQRESILSLRGDSSVIDSEIAALHKYLRDSSYPDGRLRSFPGTAYKASQALSLSIKRFRQRVSALDPQLGDHIASHLVTSPLYCWKKHPGGQSGSLPHTPQAPDHRPGPASHTPGPAAGLHSPAKDPVN